MIDKLIVRADTNEEFKKLQELAFNHGYKWSTNNTNIIDKRSDNYLVFYTKDKTIKKSIGITGPITLAKQHNHTYEVIGYTEDIFKSKSTFKICLKS